MLEKKIQNNRIYLPTPALLHISTSIRFSLTGRSWSNLKPMSPFPLASAGTSSPSCFSKAGTCGLMVAVFFTGFTSGLGVKAWCDGLCFDLFDRPTCFAPEETKMLFIYLNLVKGHCDYTAIGSSVTVLPAVSSGDYAVTIQSLCSHCA